MSLIALSPLVAMAGGGIGEGGTFQSVIAVVIEILDILVILIMALALVFFLWGLAKFVLNAGDPEAQAQGKSIMFWGLIALFVMVAVWGLVLFLQTSLGVPEGEIVVPAILPTR